MATKAVNEYQERSRIVFLSDRLVWSAWNRQKDEVKRLLLEKANVNHHLMSDGWTAIACACYRSDAQILKILLTAKDIDVNKQNWSAESSTALHFATQKAAFGCLELLLKSDKINVNVTNRSGYTPLHHAVMDNAYPIIESLLRHPEIDTSVIVESLDILRFALHHSIRPYNPDIISIIRRSVEKRRDNMKGLLFDLDLDVEVPEGVLELIALYVS